MPRRSRAGRAATIQAPWQELLAEAHRALRSPATPCSSGWPNLMCDPAGAAPIPVPGGWLSLRPSWPGADALDLPHRRGLLPQAAQGTLRRRGQSSTRSARSTRASWCAGSALAHRVQRSGVRGVPRSRAERVSRPRPNGSTWWKWNSPPPPARLSRRRAWLLPYRLCRLVRRRRMQS
ncbi:hypothetical protein ACPA9J_04035 [Pseudomonas aeruginosa]